MTRQREGVPAMSFPWQMSMRLTDDELAWLRAQPEGITGTVRRLIVEAAAAHPLVAGDTSAEDDAR